MTFQLECFISNHGKEKYNSINNMSAITNINCSHGNFLYRFHARCSQLKPKWVLQVSYEDQGDGIAALTK